jgi:hypothetical protein
MWMLRSTHFLDPRIGLFALSALFAFDYGILAAQGESVNPIASILWNYGCGLIVAWWVAEDRRKRKFSAPFEFEAAMFFAWPVLLPYYFYQTRGGKGVLLAIAVYCLVFGPAVVGGIVGRMAYILNHAPYTGSK